MKLTLALMTLLASATIISAEEAKPEEFTADASNLVREYAGQQSIQYLGQIKYFDEMNRRNHLTKKEGSENRSLAYGVWAGENSSGKITVYASFSGPESILGNEYNRFWVRFDYPKETPMPEALLSQLTAKAVKTEMIDRYPPEARHFGRGWRAASKPAVCTFERQPALRCSPLWTIFARTIGRNNLCFHFLPPGMNAGRMSKQVIS